MRLIGLGTCRAREGLETLEEVTTNGPWSTTVETVGGVKKDVIMGTPEFTIRGRATGGGAVNDVCSKPSLFPGVSNIVEGVLVTFVVAETLDCSEGGRNAGVISGEETIKLENKRILSVS